VHCQLVVEYVKCEAAPQATVISMALVKTRLKVRAFSFPPPRKPAFIDAALWIEKLTPVFRHISLMTVPIESTTATDKSIDLV
jgi:hypothetical protein